MENTVQNIPDSLVYEMIDGKPIYYQNYGAYLEGKKGMEEIMGSSYIQSLIITRLVYLLMSNLGKGYQVLTNEVGLQFGEKSWRAADIAIVETKKLGEVGLDNKYLKVAPKIVIEIDTKAEIKDLNVAYGYFHVKTEELLDFGVEKVIWIFTDTRKVMVAEAGKDWQIMDWAKDVFVLDNLSVNVEELLCG